MCQVADSCSESDSCPATDQHQAGDSGAQEYRVHIVGAQGGSCLEHRAVKEKVERKLRNLGCLSAKLVIIDMQR